MFFVVCFVCFVCCGFSCSVHFFAWSTGVQRCCKRYTCQINICTQETGKATVRHTAVHRPFFCGDLFYIKFPLFLARLLDRRSCTHTAPWHSVRRPMAFFPGMLLDDKADLSVRCPRPHIAFVVLVHPLWNYCNRNTILEYTCSNDMHTLNETLIIQFRLAGGLHVPHVYVRLPAAHWRQSAQRWI